MKAQIIFLLFVALAVKAPSSGAAVNAVSPNTRQAILMDYAAIDAATHMKDLNRLMSYLAPDYVVHTGGSVFSAAYSRRRQAQMFAGSNAVTSKTVLLNMTMRGEVVVATITQYMTVIVSDAKSGRQTKYAWQAREQDAWMRAARG